VTIIFVVYAKANDVDDRDRNLKSQRAVDLGPPQHWITQIAGAAELWTARSGNLPSSLLLCSIAQGPERVSSHHPPFGDTAPEPLGQLPTVTSDPPAVLESHRASAAALGTKITEVGG